MKISKYTLFSPNYPTVSEHLIYHSRTQALVKINEELKGILESLDTPSPMRGTRYEKDLMQLFKMGFLVKDDADDRQRLERFMEQRKYGANPEFFHASILTTYNCNFACTYCFEESTRKGIQRLDRETSDQIIAWVKAKVKKIGVRRLLINYYGGEPLMNQEAIEYISSTFYDWCRSEGVVFQFMMQTNGYLLTPELVDRYKAIGLKGVQISVDGTPEIHDAQLPLRGSGEGTFQKVLQNLRSIIDNIKVVVAAQYDNGDPTGVIGLMDYLDELGILHKLERFTHTAVHPSLGPAGHTHEVQSPQCMSNYQTDKILRAERLIKEAKERKGLSVRSGLAASMCPVTTANGGVTIDTKGSIYKCTAMLGHPELAVGHVKEEGYNQMQRDFLDSDSWKKCDSDCPYVPLCNSGCRLFAYFKTKDFMEKSCEREYMDKMVPEAIKKEYELQRAAQRAKLVGAAG